MLKIIIKKSKAKKLFIKTVSSIPLHLVVPFPAVREFATLHYLNSNLSSDDLCKYISDTGQLTFNTLTSTKIAVQAVFNAHRDDILEKLLPVTMAKYPEVALFYELAADIDTFRGDLTSALFYASRAHFLAPESVTATARAVNLKYVVSGPDAADDLALDSLKRFRRSSAVLWAVCKNCTSEAQLDRIIHAWREKIKSPGDLALAVRPLANAAARVERFDIAIDLYAEASLLELNGEGANIPVKSKQLAGKGALTVITDLTDALQMAGIPSFLCAGTALGIVRNGRPLDHDNDIDVGIFEEHWSRERLIEIFTDNSKFKLDNPHPLSSKIGLLHRSGASVDLFRFYQEKDFIWHDSVFVRWKNTPFSLKTIEINGSKVQIPEPEDKYLTENYGDWRTPDPEFDAFISSNTEVLWPEYLEFHLVRQAYKKIRANKVDSARHNLFKAKGVLEKLPSGKKLSEKIFSSQ